MFNLLKFIKNHLLLLSKFIKRHVLSFEMKKSNFTFCAPMKTERLFSLVSFSDWTGNPTINDIESMTSPVEEIIFPSVTICPKSPNPDRWGPTIKMFDSIKRKCR